MPNVNSHGHPVKLDYTREQFIPNWYQIKTGRPRPREANFIPEGTRKDIKIKMSHKLS